VTGPGRRATREAVAHGQHGPSGAGTESPNLALAAGAIVLTLVVGLVSWDTRVASGTALGCALLIAAVVAVIAARKGRVRGEIVGWFIVGFFGSVVALAVVLLVRPRARQ
jgi:hypothetical protein